MLIRADARRLPLRDACVDCVVTSPPYFGLRDYGRSDQIGLEPTPDAYVESLVSVFREVRRVLKDSGTVWLNLGDSYATVGGAFVPQQGAAFKSSARGVATICRSKRMGRGEGRWGGGNAQACGYVKPKDLVGVPWAVAFALRDDGWYLRSDIIWAKPNPMPESVTDRPTKSHEYLFLLAKAKRYYYDAAAIREPYATSTLTQFEKPYKGVGIKDYAMAGVQNPSAVKRRITDKQRGHGRRHAGFNDRLDAMPKIKQQLNGANKRTVWTVPTMPYAGAHFATMPEALVEPCILAGCPLGGMVLDPFVGSGTVVAVAERLGRRGVGVDLGYQDLAKARTAQRGLLHLAAEESA